MMKASEIGDGLLIEFFRRLPLKSLFKFKCVSKRWLSLISDPSMRRLYYNHPRPGAPTYALLCRHLEFPDLRFDPHIKIKTHPKLECINIPLGFVCKEPGKVIFVAAHNGLLLTHDLSNNDRQAYYVSSTDPFSAGCAAVPALPKDGAGIGFIARSDSTYSVILVSATDSRTLALQLLDSRSGRWRSSTAVLSRPARNSDSFMEPGVLYKGALHWVFGYNGDSRIVAFDPALHESEGDDYRCPVLNSPHPYQPGIPCLQRLFGLSGGELRYAELIAPYARDQPSFVFVWLLKDYDSDSPTWCLEHEIVCSDLATIFYAARGNDDGIRVDDAHCLNNFNPVDKDVIYFKITPSRRDRGGLEYTQWLVSYNVCTRTADVLCRQSAVRLVATPARRISDEMFAYPNISVLPCVLPNEPMDAS